MNYFVEVIVPLALDPTFTYAVNEAEYEFIQVGMRVAVPFGRSKVYTAVVIEKHNRLPEYYEAKEINEIIDLTPVVTEKQIALWKWLSDYYMCTIGDVYKSAMPSQLLLESETMIQFNPASKISPDDLDDAEYLIYEALQVQSILKVEEIIAILNRKKVFPVINLLLEKKMIFLQEEMVEKYKPKQVRYVKLAEQYLVDNGLADLMEIVSRSEKQREMILKYFQLHAVHKKPITVKQLVEESESTSAIVKALITKGIFEEYYLNQDRVIFGDAKQDVIELSDEQSKALWEIGQSLETKDVVLLHGVTASGKTEVYIKLIEKYIANEGQVLFLLPGR